MTNLPDRIWVLVGQMEVDGVAAFEQGGGWSSIKFDGGIECTPTVLVDELINTMCDEDGTPTPAVSAAIVKIQGEL